MHDQQLDIGHVRPTPVPSTPHPADPTSSGSRDLRVVEPAAPRPAPASQWIREAEAALDLGLMMKNTAKSLPREGDDPLASTLDEFSDYLLDLAVLRGLRPPRAQLAVAPSRTA